MDWSTFTLAEWDGFTLSDWDTFLLDPSALTAGFYAAASDTFVPQQIGDIFAAGADRVKVFAAGKKRADST